MGIPGRDLNYDETVVYVNEAIRPVYMITYGRPEGRPRLRFRIRRPFEI